MAEVKWIKIVTDIFDDEKILLIESMPDRDAVIVIWFKLLCLAGKQNNGGVFMLNDKIPYTDEMLSTIFRRPINTVRLALDTFQHFGMIEIVNDCITIPNWDKHQSLDALEKKREYQRQLMKKRREEQWKIACNTNCDANCEANCDANSDANVSSLDIDIERDKEEDIISSADKPQKTKRFTPPTVEEVRAYCKERGNNVDAERFVDYYTSNGWHVGKNSMKDWKAAVRTWERQGWNGYGFGGKQQKKQSNSSIDDDMLRQIMNPYGT